MKNRLMNCRLCGSGDLLSVVDLGATPPCELFLSAEQVDEPEMTYPLHLRVCTSCWLAQLPPLITPEETFIWVVTKTEARWVRSNLGTSALAGEVEGLAFVQGDGPGPGDRDEVAVPSRGVTNLDGPVVLFRRDMDLSGHSSSTGRASRSSLHSLPAEEATMGAQS